MTTTDTAIRHLPQLVREAKAATATKQWVEAVALCDAILADGTHRVPIEVYVFLAKALRHRGEYERASSALAAGLSMQPDHKGLLDERMRLDGRLAHDRAGAPGDVYYGNRAATYQKQRETGRRWAAEHEAVRLLLSNLPDGAAVLDVPFGTGRFVPLYVDKAMRITGIDVSKDMLDAAAAELGDAVRHCTLERCDAASIQHADSSFDVVVCVRFLQNIVPLGLVKKVLLEIARVTGRHAILELEVRRDFAIDVGKPSDDQPMRGFFYRREVEEMLRTAGLKIERSIDVYDAGATAYVMLLCRKLS